MRIGRNIKLAKHSHYRIGGPARYFAHARNEAQIKEATAFARENKLPILVLGGGTNFLISDKGFGGLVLRPDIRILKKTGNEVEVGAGVAVGKLLDFCAKHKLSGLEWAGGLPGTVGGAIRGNAGCFGGETKDSIKSVKSLRISDGKIIERKVPACKFGYRMSVFKKSDGKEIILSAVFGLKPGSPEKIKKSIKEKVDYRLARHPMERPSIGSTFKNVPLQKIFKKGTASYKEAEREGMFAWNKISVPVKNDPFPVIPVAFLIAQTGVMGKRAGKAMISPKHPNFIVNLGGAKAKDVEKLITLVKKAVWQRFKIRIEEEIIRT